MTETKYVVLCDDRAERVRRWKRSVERHLPDGWVVTTITGEDLAAMVESLAALEAWSRDLAPSPLPAESDTIARLNAASVVIIDSDLSPDPKELAGLKEKGEAVGRALRSQYGDAIAQQVRTYTTAGFIAVANMFVGRDAATHTFDLTLTQGVGTNADLHIGGPDLGIAALWTGAAPRVGDYNPWHWPALLDAGDWVRASEAAVKDVDARVLPTLGLRSADLNPKQADLFRGRTPEETTFSEIANSRLGFKYPEARHDEAAVRRMAASVVRRWLTRIVLPASDLISDAPHLATRFPQILGDQAGDPRAWESLTLKNWDVRSSLPNEPDAALDSVRPFLDRCVFSVSLARTLKQSSVVPLRLVFLEDRSRFVTPDEADQFETDLSGSYFRRFVTKKRSSSIAYEPFTRLLT